MFHKKRECRAVSDLLWNYLARRLPESDIERVEAHLPRCAQCAGQLEEARRTVALVAAYREEAVPASETSWCELRARLEAQTQSAGTPATRRWAVPLVWGGAAFAMAALAFVLFGSRQPVNSALAVRLHERPKENKLPLLPIYEAQNKKPAQREAETAPPIQPHKTSARLPHRERSVAVKRNMSSRPHHPARFRAHRNYHKQQPPSETDYLAKNETGTTTLTETAAPPEPEEQLSFVSVDGDLPATQEPSCVYVMSSAPASEEPSQPRRYVMGSVSSSPDSSPTVDLASQHSETAELQAW